MKTEVVLGKGNFVNAATVPMGTIGRIQSALYPRYKGLVMRTYTGLVSLEGDHGGAVWDSEATAAHELEVLPIGSTVTLTTEA